MKISVRVPGSCGELVQGLLQDDSFLVTCPINRYSEAVIQTATTFAAVLPSKAMLALELTLAKRKIKDRNFKITLSSQLPKGKGMASSSADIAAVCQAVASFYGQPLAANEVAAIALAIEPTDGVFFSGITLFDHVSGNLYQSMGNPPTMEIMIFDTGGAVDTISFNQRHDLRQMNKQKRHQVLAALQMVKQGIDEEDGSLLAQGATISALANQPILFKPDLDKFWKIGREMGAMGVNVAHSGTVIGLFISDKQIFPVLELVKAVESVCSIRYLDTVRLISGGLWIQEGDDIAWRKCL